MDCEKTCKNIRPCLKNIIALYYFNKMVIAAIFTNAKIGGITVGYKRDDGIAIMKA